jgi:hypothetical protein
MTAGASLETFAALAGVIAGAGIKGTRGGTALKNIFLAISAPEVKAQKMFRHLKVKTEDAQHNVRDVIDVIGDLNKAMEGMGTAGRSGVIKAIFGKIPIAAANKLLNAGKDELNGYRDSLNAAFGDSEKMATFLRNTFLGRWKAFKSAVEGVKISTFSLSNDGLSTVVEKMTEWVRVNEKLIAGKLGNFITMLIDNFEDIVLWTKRIAIGLGVFLGFVTVLKTLALVLTVVNLLMMANPITLMVLAFVALIAAVAAVIFWWDNLAAAFRGAGLAVDALLIGIALLGGPITALAALAALLFKHWEPVGKFFEDLWAGITGTFDAALVRMEITARKIATLGGLLDFGSDDDDGVSAPARRASRASNRRGRGGIVSPAQRAARAAEEVRTTSSAEVTIRDETGRAEVTGGALGHGVALEASGAF